MAVEEVRLIGELLVVVGGSGIVIPSEDDVVRVASEERETMLSLLVASAVRDASCAGESVPRERSAILLSLLAAPACEAALIDS